MRQARLFQLHHLVGPVADVELVIEPLAAVDHAVVVGDELADVGGEQGLVGLAAGRFDLRGLGHHAPPILDRAIQPHVGVFLGPGIQLAQMLGHQRRLACLGLRGLGGRIGRAAGSDERERDTLDQLAGLAGGEPAAIGSLRRAALALHVDHHGRLGRLAARVRGLHPDPVQEVLTLGGPVERLAPILDVGQRRSPEREIVTDRAVLGGDHNDRQPALQERLALLAAQSRLFLPEAEADLAVGQQQSVVGRDPRSARVVLQPDHVPVVAEVIERLLRAKRRTERRSHRCDRSSYPTHPGVTPTHDVSSSKANAQPLAQR